MKKLVRDKIPDEINNDGRKAVIHIADDSEYEEMLIDKLKEEVDEFLESKNVEELADIIEISHAITKFKGEDIEEVRREKAVKKGKFEKRIILDEICD
jgi:predicted house-cleaning noncanonical NTP pyrophosphatase (MazG superfamily)